MPRIPRVTNRVHPTTNIIILMYYLRLWRKLKFDALPITKPSDHCGITSGPKFFFEEGFRSFGVL